MWNTLRPAVLVVACLLLLVDLAAAQLVTSGRVRETVRLASQSVDATLEDGLALVKLRQVFRHEGRSTVEAVYTFPLPDDASMTGMTLTVDGVVMEGVLKERKKARRVYEEIVRTKRDPALLEQVGDGLFRLSVYPVAPGVDTIVEIEYAQPAPLLDGAFLLTLPLGGTAAGAAATTVHVDVRSSRELGTVTPSLPGAHVTREGRGRATVSYERAAGSTAPLPDGLSVTAALASGAPSFAVESYRGPEGETCFVAVYSPGTPERDDLLPRDVLLVLDTSGSMTGKKIEQARDAAHWLVDNLGPRDRVNIVRFSSDVSATFTELREATPANREALHGAIDRFGASGSTALADALAHVAELEPVRGRSRSVVLLTDGLPTLGETRPVKLIELASKIGAAGLRMQTFGVGQDVDAGLLHATALATGGGTEVFDNPLEIEPRLRRFLARTSAPALRDLRLTAKGATLSRVHPRRVPDAYLGEQVVVTGVVQGDGPVEFALEGEGPDGRVSVTDALLIGPKSHGRRVVALQQATQRLADLDAAQRLRRQLPAAAYEAAYEAASRYWDDVDRGRYRVSEELTAEMVETSLRYGVQCAYTSFIAVEASELGRLDRTSEDAILDELESTAGAAGRRRDSPFDANDANPTIGIGGGAGGKYGGRFGGNRNLRAAGGAGIDQAIKDGLEWLRKHQDENGMWDADGFSKHDPENDRTNGAGEADDDVGETGLALLAFLGDGHTMTRGGYKNVVKLGIKGLLTTQDPVTGLIASGDGSDPVLQHAIATLALCECYYIDKSITLKTRAQKAIDYLVAAQKADGSWPLSDGAIERRRLVMGWVLLALKTGEEGKLRVDTRAFAAALRWLDERTDRATGRVRADPPSDASDGKASADESTRDLPARTAEALLCRVFVAKDPWDHGTRMNEHAWWLGASARSFDPRTPWDPIDWYYGTTAMYQAGGESWKAWWKIMRPPVLNSQRKDGSAKGSWDPVEANGRGRVATTALMALTLEARYRYARVANGR